MRLDLFTSVSPEVDAGLGVLAVRRACPNPGLQYRSMRDVIRRGGS